MRLLLILSPLFAALPSQPAISVTTAPAYVAAGSWRAIGEDGRCTIERDLLASGKQMTLAIAALPLRASATVSLRRPDPRGGTTAIAATVGDGGKVAAKAQALLFDRADGRGTITRVRVDRSVLDAAAKSEVLALRFGKDPADLFPVAELGKALTAFDRCRQAIVNAMQVMPADPHAISTQAFEPPMLFRIDQSEFKDEATHDLEDVAVAAYTIAADGAVESCAIVHHARDQRLNRGACWSWGGLKFTPAKSADGGPIRGLYFTENRWHAKVAYGS